MPRPGTLLVALTAAATLLLLPVGAHALGTAPAGATSGSATSGSATSGSATSGSAKVSVPSSAPPAGRTRITPERFGANGTDTADDTTALQRALDALGTTNYLDVPAGKTYRHRAVLKVTRTGSWIHGAGTLLATDEEQAAIFADAANVTLDGGLTIGLTRWTKRHDNWETFGLRSLNTTGLTMLDVTMSQTELYLNHSAKFSLSRIAIDHSQADGLHITGGSHDGMVTDVTTTWTGDDGVAVVSYQQDGVPCSNITITRPRVLGTTWGRGISVIGGTNITYTDVYVERTSAAGIIVAAESSYQTFAPRNVSVLGGTVVKANQGTVGHGAVLVHSSRSDADLGGKPLDNVLIRNIAIRDTALAPGYNVRIGTDPGATLHRVVMSYIAITRGPATALNTNQGPSALTTHYWKHDGTLVFPLA
jgi:hypothetical protein